MDRRTDRRGIACLYYKLAQVKLKGSFYVCMPKSSYAVRHAPYKMLFLGVVSFVCSDLAIACVSNVFSLLKKLNFEGRLSCTKFGIYTYICIKTLDR